MKPSITVLGICVALGVMLTGCSPNASSLGVTEEAADTPTSIPATPTAELQEVDQCLSCHQDKEMLIDTAKLEEEIVSENSGEG